MGIITFTQIIPPDFTLANNDKRSLNNLEISHLITLTFSLHNERFYRTRVKYKKSVSYVAQIYSQQTLLNCSLFTAVEEYWFILANFLSYIKFNKISVSSRLKPSLNVLHISETKTFQTSKYSIPV